MGERVGLVVAGCRFGHLQRGRVALRELCSTTANITAMPLMRPMGGAPAISPGRRASGEFRRAARSCRRRSLAWMSGRAWCPPSRRAGASGSLRATWARCRRRPRHGQRAHVISGNLRLYNAPRMVGPQVLKRSHPSIENRSRSAMLAANNTALRVLQEVTRTVPIVFAQVADPVGSGHVASLARPGGNITGFALYEPAIAVKWLELLKEIAPSIARVAGIYDPTDFNSKHMQEIEAVIASFGVQLFSFLIRNVSDIERAIDGFSTQPHGGLIILPGPFTVVLAISLRHALPNVHAYRYYPAARGLASYGVDNVKSYLGAASSRARNRRTCRCRRRPNTNCPVVNLKTAKTLGLEIFASLARAPTR